MYCEEMDRCRRFWRNGWRVLVAPAARIIHHEAQSSRKAPWQTGTALAQPFSLLCHYAAEYPAGTLAKRWAVGPHGYAAFGAPARPPLPVNGGSTVSNRIRSERPPPSCVCRSCERIGRFARRTGRRHPPATRHKYIAECAASLRAGWMAWSCQDSGSDDATQGHRATPAPRWWSAPDQLRRPTPGRNRRRRCALDLLCRCRRRAHTGAGGGSPAM